jgi:LacI family transcriptional regulator
VAVRSTIYEVARRSGVSTATVSRVMAEGKGFSAETGERVRATAAELGWVPNGPARGLASRRTGIVGLIFPDLGGGSGQAHEESALYVDQVIRGAERAATVAGDAVLIAATQCASGRKLAFSLAGKADGLVILARSLSDDDVVALSRIVPVVMLANRLARKGPDYVEADNRGGSRAMTAHLIGVHGYTDLIFLAGPEQSPDSEERFAGFRDALAHAGLPEPDRPAASGDFTETGGEVAVRGLLARGGRPRAIVCGNDEMALGALTALRSARLRVPGDVAVTGFDDISAARHVRPALTTVRQPMRELGERSVRLLFDRIADRDRERRSVMLPTDVVIRRSCGCTSRHEARTRAAGPEASSRPAGPEASSQPAGLETSSRPAGPMISQGSR